MKLRKAVRNFMSRKILILLIAIILTFILLFCNSCNSSVEEPENSSPGTEEKLIENTDSASKPTTEATESQNSTEDMDKIAVSCESSLHYWSRFSAKDYRHSKSNFKAVSAYGSCIIAKEIAADGILSDIFRFLFRLSHIWCRQGFDPYS